MKWTPKQIRKLRGKMTQVEFAARLDVSPSTVSRWERGDRRPHRHCIRALEGLLRSSA